MKTLLLTLVTLFATNLYAQEVPSVVSGCTTADFMMADLESSINTQGRSYTPRCLQVVVGSKVTIDASKHHPLAPIAQDNNPIGNTESTTTYTFDQPGVYGYFCTKHGDSSGQGMAGAIWVVEQ